VLHLGGVEEALSLSDPASKSISCGALVLPGESRQAHVLLSSDGLGAGRSEGAIRSSDGGRRW
jgi:hypothetical protein